MSDDDIARASRAKFANPFLSTAQAAWYLGISQRHLERLRARGEGPVFRRHTRHIRYHLDDLTSWSEGTRGMR
jgi:excisionase family DNA binding protein